MISPVPPLRDVSGTFFKKQKERIKYRLKRHLGIRLGSRREIITDLFQSTNADLKCEIATLPFSECNVLENPIIKEADIIHLHWVSKMLDFPSFFVNNRKPVIWTLHDMNAFQGLFHYKEDEIRNKIIAEKLDRRILAIKEKVIQKRKSKLIVVTPSRWLLEKAMASKAFTGTSGYSIPNPVSTEIFRPSLNVELRDSLKIPPGNIVFLFVAERIENYRKGFDLLLWALKNLKHKQITLLIIGSTHNLDILETDIRLLGVVNDNVLLRDYYSIADAFIIPSREDNLPNVMLESLACGTPVIGFSVGGIKEHIVDYETGLLAMELNSQSLASAIESFCKNKDLFIRGNIRNYAEEHFNENMIAKKYIDVYNEILEQP
ncbi:MAG: glycosyltransferase [Ginsengibacter sp.]